jgi:hypothetical protein
MSRWTLCLALLLGGCAGEMELVVPEARAFPWLRCAIDPDTGGPLQPNCVEPPTLTLHVPVVALDGAGVPVEGVGVRATSGTPGVFLALQAFVEATAAPPEWPGSDEVYAELTGRAQGGELATVMSGTTDEDGRVDFFAFVEDLESDADGAPLPTTIGFVAGELSGELRLEPVR